MAVLCCPYETDSRFASVCLATIAFFRARLDKRFTVRIVSTGSDWQPVVGLFDALNEHLDDAWDCYFRPHLNGLRPDIVLMHEQKGVVSLRLLDFSDSARRAVDDWQRKPAGSRIQDVEVRRAFDGLVADHAAISRLLGQTGNAATPIQSVVVLTHATDKDVSALDDAWRREVELSTRVIPQLKFRSNKTTHALISLDSILRSGIPDTFLSIPEGAPFSPDSARRLARWMTEPHVLAVQSTPLELNAAQLRLSRERTPTGRRRIQGPAGSGKSLVLAARAATLAAEGKQVLILSYNKTLWHYLYNLFARHLRTLVDGDKNEYNTAFFNCHFNHFHGYLRDICEQTADSEADYKNLFAQRKNGPPPTDEIVKLARSVLGQLGPRYDAIMVDEGQDWDATWVPILQESIRPGGELLVAEDVTQDIYGRTNTHRDKQARFGIRANTRELSQSFRLHPAMIPVLQSFSNTYLRGDQDIPAPFGATQLGELSLALYAAKSDDDIVERAVAATLHAYTHFRETLAFPDLFLICPSNDLGRKIVEALPDHNVKTLSTFAGEREEFWENEHPVKASTPHSLKGWESRAVVAVFPSLKTSSHRRGLYIAMTRVLRHINGSLLGVVTQDEGLIGFARKQGFGEHNPPRVTISAPQPSGGRSRADSRRPSKATVPIGAIVTLEVGGQVELYELVSGPGRGTHQNVEACTASSPLGQLIASLPVGGIDTLRTPGREVVQVKVLSINGPKSA